MCGGDVRTHFDFSDKVLSHDFAVKGLSQLLVQGILASTFPSKKSGKQLAAVYVPTAPQTKLGYIRIVEVDDFEYTDWTLQQWQLYRIAFGSVSPDRVREAAWE